MNNATLKDTYRDAKVMGKELVDNLNETGDRLERKAGETVRDVRRSLHELRDRTEDTIEDTKRAIRKNPLTSLGIAAGIAAGIGVLAGLLIGTRKHKD